MNPNIKLLTIVATSVPEALAEVNRRLGPTAVIVNVRKIGSPGLSRIWKKSQIEVQAALPQEVPNREFKIEPKSEKRLPKQRPVLEKPVGLDSGIRRRPLFDSSPPAVQSPFAINPRVPVSEVQTSTPHVTNVKPSAAIDLSQMLENLGLLPLHVKWLIDQLRETKQRRRFESLREEFAAIQEFLVDYWNRLAGGRVSAVNVTRILVGTPGVGKTTCICKWLTLEVLFENKTARVWRLDGSCANTADFLSIHGEILGVPVERVWSEESNEPATGVQFVDLPGVSAHDSSGILAVKQYLQHFNPAQVYLVLNAAYDLSHLLDHVKAFSVLPITGLILTHLDEDRRWGKFWNLLLGTRLPVVYLSADQNIPGDFCKASPSSLFDISGNQGFVD
ncbi:MAG: hypothetical protein O2960_18865 [Verrucomicrobia bacterium]|nr:hypothetical protein [Verrucomicrobiota bacterium]